MAEQSLPPQPLISVFGPGAPGFSQSQLQGTLDGAAATVSQLALKVIRYIQDAVAAAVNTGQQLAVKVATPIATAVNDAQATINQVGTQVSNQISAGITSSTAACASGCAQEQGAAYNQYQYNILQDFDVPASVFVENRDYPISKKFANLCFRAGWDSYYDAIAYKAKIQGTPPPGGCAKPGGPASSPPTSPVLPPNVPPCPDKPWQVWILVDPTTQQPAGCTVTCVGDPQPANSIPNGNPISDPVILAQVLAGTSCKPGVAPQPDWYGGCLNDAIVTWEGASNQPPGVGGVVGPYSTQNDAANAAAQANPKCVPSTGPPPPPPPCDCNVTINWPACIHIDLCDWQAFEDHLFNALCRFYRECVCKLTNDVRWSIADCDGELANVIDPWKGQCVKVATDNDPDTIIEMGSAQMGGAGFETAGNNPNPWG